MKRRLDFVGDPLPEGYEPWSCDTCTAVCNFEAMELCIRRYHPEEECAFDRDQPESNFGCFGFITKSTT